MVTQQIPRRAPAALSFPGLISLGLALALASQTARAGQPTQAGGPTGEPVILVDLSSASAGHPIDRRALDRGLDADPRVRRVQPESAPGSADAAGAVAAVEDRFRGHEERLDGSVMGALLTRVKVRVALVVQPSGQVHIWTLPAGAHLARRVSGAPASDPGYVARLVAAWADEQDHPRAPALEVPLVRDSPRTERGHSGNHTRWWVYAGVGAAIAVAAVLIVSDQLAADHQRIELTLP